MTNRKAIKSLFGGHCAYCGCELGDSFEIDHIVPIRRGSDVPYAGTDTAKNCYPACRPCNRAKKCYGLETWREVIAGKINELNRDSAAYRTAKRYGLLQETGEEVVFYFERFPPPTMITRSLCCQASIQTVHSEWQCARCGKPCDPLAEEPQAQWRFTCPHCGKDMPEAQAPDHEC